MENMQNDPLWKQAERRAAFKRNLASYIIINLFLIGVWYISSRNHNVHFWPIWPILGWGLGVVMQYLGVYHTNSVFSVDREYEKLKNENR